MTQLSGNFHTGRCRIITKVSVVCRCRNRDHRITFWWRQHMATRSSYRDLRIWQEAIHLALTVYRATLSFPKHELYGLTSQMRRAAVSIPSNIAKGKGRGSDGDFGRFLFQARGSLLELQTQIVIARGLEYLSQEQTTSLTDETDALGRGLNGLIQGVRPQKVFAVAKSERRTTNSERRTTGD